MRPPVSVIIPHFNRPLLLAETLHALSLCWNEQDEAVIVDDGSTSCNVELLERIVHQFPWVRLRRHDRNLGGAAARNTAVRCAEHDWLFCIDSDNIPSFNLVDSLVRAAISSHLEIAVPETIVFFRDGDSLPTHTWRFQAREITIEDHLIADQVPSASGNYLFSRRSWESAGGYIEEAGALDAWSFGFRQVVCGSSMKAVPGTYYYHRYGHDSYWTLESRRKRSMSAFADTVVWADRSVLSRVGRGELAVRLACRRKWPRRPIVRLRTLQWGRREPSGRVETLEQHEAESFGNELAILCRD